MTRTFRASHVPTIRDANLPAPCSWHHHTPGPGFQPQAGPALETWPSPGSVLLLPQPSRLDRATEVQGSLPGRPAAGEGGTLGSSTPQERDQPGRAGVLPTSPHLLTPPCSEAQTQESYLSLRPHPELHPEHLPPSSAWPVTSSCHWRGHCPNTRPPTLQPRYSWGSGNQHGAEGSKCQREEGRPCPPCPFKVTGALSVEGTGGHYRTRAPEHSCRDGHRSGQGAAPTSDPSSRENESGPRGECG